MSRTAGQAMSPGRIFTVFLINALILGDAIALPRQDRVTEIEAARRAYWEGRFKVAVAGLEPLLEKLEDRQALQEAAFLLGLSYLALGEDSRGKDYFKKAIAFDSSFTPSDDIYPTEIIETYESLRGQAVGQIVVLSDPAGADVRIGGRSVGKTPYSGDTATGEHTVQVELQGYSAQARKLRVVAGETRTVTFKLGRGAAPAPPAPAGETAPTEEFHQIKMVLQQGETTAERDAVLRLERERMIVVDEKAGFEMKSISYRDIRAAEYAYSKNPRWKAGLGAEVAVGVLAAPISFLKGKKHWLTVQTEDDYVLLRLDEKNYEPVCLSFEAHSGLRVEHLGEE